MMRPLSFYKEKFISLLFNRTAAINGDIPIEECRYVALDTELTGLDANNDSIISIGAVKMSGARIDLGDVFYRLTAPTTEMRHESIVIHGITPSDVAEKPSIETVISELIDFCGDETIVGHFISLDMEFINKQMRRIYGTPLNNHAVDTYRIHEWIKSNDGNFSSHYNWMSDELNLFSIARKYRIHVSGAHNALNDAFITAQLFQRFLSFLPGFGVSRLGDLLRIGRP